MRNALAAMCLLPCAQFLLAQGASPKPSTDDLIVRISEDGTCHVFDASAPCKTIGDYLLEKHLAKNAHIHIAVDQTSKYELVVATLESLQRSGINVKVGFVNYDANASP